MDISGRSRHRLWYHIGHYFFKLYFSLRFRLKISVRKPSAKPYLLLTNHVTDLDPLLLCASFSEPMYFVASDHIFRWGLASRLIRFFQNPIPLLKGTADSQAVRQILGRLRGGSNVCILAEGSTTYTGNTAAIAPAIGKLVRLSGVPLVTATLRGGYLTRPRWSHTYRKGYLESVFAHEYSPDELKKMSVDEINARIREDLSVSAIDDQKALGEAPVHYKGKSLAEGIENVLYLCPRCGQFSKITSHEDIFECTCGLKGRFTDTGFLESADSLPLPFSTIPEWDNWQKESALQKALSVPPETAVLSHPHQSLYTFARSQTPELLCEGTLSLYRDRLEIVGKSGTFAFPFQTLPKGVTFYGSGSATLGLTDSNGTSYEIKTAIPRPALCYAFLSNALKTVNAQTNRQED